jgi:3-oxoacyl-[acyl-carrier protein] reductase
MTQTQDTSSPRKILVTGCASGIGLAQTQLFLARGELVYGIDQKPSPQIQHPNFTFIQTDLSGDLTALWLQLPDVFDVICQTAGVLDDYLPLLETSDEIFAQLWAINVGAVIQLTRHFLPAMIQQKSGVLIQMCSIASFVAGGGGIAYTTSKHALAGFTKQLALDYARTGVQIFGIAPGAVKTGMTQHDFDTDNGKMADWVANETPVGRWAEPSEVAELTAFLASGKASYMHGEIIKIDGGWTLK